MDYSYAKQKLSLLVRDIANYTNDEFRCQMARIVSGATGQDIPDDCHTIKAERDALAAQVEAIAKDRDDWKNAMARAASVLLLHKVPTKNINVDKALAEVKAEAVIEFAKEYGGKFSGLPDFASSAVSLFADQCAAKVRNAGTWLKDSNVNGGKRQGGEK